MTNYQIEKMIIVFMKKYGFSSHRRGGAVTRKHVHHFAAFAKGVVKQHADDDSIRREVAAIFMAIDDMGDE